MQKLIRNVFILFLGLFVSLVNAAETTPESIPGTTKVSAAKVIELYEDLDELVIIDARTTADFKKGHIPDAVHLVNTDTNAETLAEVLATKATPVVFYCNGVKCGRSVAASEIAVQAGYTNVYWFRGGIEEWRAAGYPEEK